MRRDTILMVGAGLVAMIAGLVLFTLWQQPRFASATPVDTIPPALGYADLVFADLDGNQRSLSEWPAPLQIINLWAPWCAPCRQEIPALIEVQRNHPEKLQIIGLAFDSPANVRNFSDEFEFNYPLLLVEQHSRQINQYLGNSSGGLPFTAILDARREIVFRHAGEIDSDQLERQISAFK